MPTYTPSNNLFPSTEIIEYSDNIEGGLNGIDNIPWQNESDRLKYIFDKHNTLIVSESAPVIGTLQNRTNSLWYKPTTATFSSFNGSSWVNISKDFILNVDDLRINDTGSSYTPYAIFEVQYGVPSGSNTVVLKNDLGTMINLNCGTLKSNSTNYTGTLTINNNQYSNYEFVVQSQADWDSLWDTVGANYEFKTDSGTPSSIFVESGLSLTSTKQMIFSGSTDLKIDFGPGASITCNYDAAAVMQITGSIIVDIDISFICTGHTYDHCFNDSSTKIKTIKINVTNGTFSSGALYVGQSASVYIIDNGTTATHSIFSTDSAIINGSINGKTTGTFYQCTNLIVNAIVDGTAILGTGDFDL